MGLRYDHLERSKRVVQVTAGQGNVGKGRGVWERARVCRKGQGNVGKGRAGKGKEG